MQDQSHHDDLRDPGGVRPVRFDSAAIVATGRRLCLAGMALGLIGLVGSMTGLEQLTTAVPGLPPMSPNSAIALCLAGAAGALGRPERATRLGWGLSIVAAVGVLLFGAAIAVAYAFGANIDQFLLIRETGPYAGPSPFTAWALVCLGGALLLRDVNPEAKARPSEWLALSSALTALTALTGYLLASVTFYRIAAPSAVWVALPTALSLILTSSGVLLDRPAAGVMRVATSQGPGGVLFRRLALVVLVGDLLIGYLVTLLHVEQHIPITLAIFGVAITVVSLALLMAAARPIDRAHDALESSRARTRALIEQAADGMFLADLSGRYTDVNGAGCRMLGLSRDEIVGKTIVDLIPPDEVERLGRSKKRLLGGGVDVDEWRLRRKDGSYLPVEVSARILPDGRWQGIVRDISERKRAEQALRLSEAKFSGIINISADAIVSIDAQQRITMFNAGAEESFGYSKEEVIGAPLDILIPERLREAHREHVRRFAAGPDGSLRVGDRNATIVGLRRNGDEFPADASISKLDVDGTPILTAVLRDITAQKRTEAEQRFLAEAGEVLAASLEYEETLTTLAQLAVRDLAELCIVDVIDDDGQLRRLRVVCRNPAHAWISYALANRSDRREEPPLLQSVFDSMQPLLIEKMTPQEVASLALDEHQLRALRGFDPRSIIVVPLLASGWCLGAVTLSSSTGSRCYDQSDLRMAEELARRAALSIENARLYRAAQRATRDRDDLMGVVAHDLRTPLGVVLMQAALLRRSGAGGGPLARDPAQVIERAAGRMARLIKDLLDVTRLEAGHLTIERAALSPGQVVRDAVESQKVVAEASAIDLRVDVPSGLPEVWADRDRLLQVFENLIANALKFTRPQGCITVAASRADGHVLFRVADTGVGIAPEDVPHVFDRFWRGESATHHGAGLGLPIVQAIVNAHGGHAWVESQLTQGSVFFFTIPVVTHTERWQMEAASTAG